MPKRRRDEDEVMPLQSPQANPTPTPLPTNTHTLTNNASMGGDDEENVDNDANLTREERKLKKLLESYSRVDGRQRKTTQQYINNDTDDVDARNNRLKHREKTRLTEDRTQIQDDGDDTEEIVTLGPSRPIHPEAWVKRQLINRGVGYLGLKHWIMQGKKLQEAAGDGVSEVIATAEMPITKAIAKMYQDKE